jgi:hypothetical protein
LTLRSKSFSNKPSMDSTTHEEQPEQEEQPLGGPSLEADSNDSDSAYAESAYVILPECMWPYIHSAAA